MKTLCLLILIAFTGLSCKKCATCHVTVFTYTTGTGSGQGVKSQYDEQLCGDDLKNYKQNDSYTQHTGLQTTSVQIIRECE